MMSRLEHEDCPLQGPSVLSIASPPFAVASSLSAAAKLSEMLHSSRLKELS